MNQNNLNEDTDNVDTEVEEFIPEAQDSYGEFVLPSEYQDAKGKSSTTDDSLYSAHLQDNWGF